MLSSPTGERLQYMLLDRIGIQRNNLLPSADVLHDRSSIGTKTVEIEPGVLKDIHLFESNVVDLLEVVKVDNCKGNFDVL